MILRSYGVRKGSKPRVAAVSQCCLLTLRGDTKGGRGLSFQGREGLTDPGDPGHSAGMLARDPGHCYWGLRNRCSTV
ncbi:hypothetical protein DM860_012575 [Cuscuta australis]|uniref:Uncharacterized protein n=1 Tax=Cuscuta australis TaxID=267555 RepID=A0A328DD19_9ASTE|nr:hypothetical protein DM860_012575 [Cuscuta australis]